MGIPSTPENFGEGVDKPPNWKRKGNQWDKEGGCFKYGREIHEKN